MQAVVVLVVVAEVISQLPPHHGLLHERLHRLLVGTPVFLHLQDGSLGGHLAWGQGEGVGSRSPIRSPGCDAERGGMAAALTEVEPGREVAESRLVGVVSLGAEGFQPLGDEGLQHRQPRRGAGGRPLHLRHRAVHLQAGVAGVPRDRLRATKRCEAVCCARAETQQQILSRQGCPEPYLRPQCAQLGLSPTCKPPAHASYKPALRG